MQLDSEREAPVEAAYELAREAILTGVAVVVPLAVTGYVLEVVLRFLLGLTWPIVDLLELVHVSPPVSRLVVNALALVGLVGVVFVVGLVAHFRRGKRAIGYVDLAIERIPGVGAVYRSFRKMSDAMLEGDAESFREVKLVEFPYDGTYTLGFETTETPEPIEAAAGEGEMVTLFLPLAPNPVMGGFLSHVPAERVKDVDMTVEEGIETILTTGVATADVEEESEMLTTGALEESREQP